MTLLTGNVVLICDLKSGRYSRHRQIPVQDQKLASPDGVLLALDLDLDKNNCDKNRDIKT